MGKGYIYKCDKCDYTIEYYQGIGFLYQMEAEQILTAMKQGKFGKRFMEAVNKAAAPAVEFSRELYRCKECGELRLDLQIDLFDGDKVILSKRHVCGKCRSQMNMVKSPRGLKCPKCKSKLVIESMIMWD